MNAPGDTGSFADTHALVRAAQQGDVTARDLLFTRYLPRVRQMLALRLGMLAGQLPADADDVVQETLLNALQAFERFEVRGDGSFRNWLARIAENRLRNEKRSKRSGKEAAFWRRYGDLDLSATVFPDEGSSPSQKAQARELGERIEQAILELPGLYRKAIELKDIAQMDHAELAKAMGKSEVNCRKIYQRARELLAQRLGGMGR